MTTILALETSGSVCSVCLEVDGTRFDDTQHVERRHNELLLPMVRDVMDRSGLGPSSLDAVAFGCGPGSFTGVRIAAAATQAISLAADAPVLRISSSHVLAQALLEAPALSPGSSTIVTCIRSRADLYYLAAYEIVGEMLECRTPDTLCGKWPGQSWVTGGLDPDLTSGVGKQPDWWPQHVVFASTIVATAGDVCTLAAGELQQGHGLAPELALPVYVAGDSPWVAR